MRNQIFYTIGSAFASGIFIRSFFDIENAGIGLLFLIALACIVAWRLTTQSNVLVRTSSPLFLTSLALFFCALGALRLDIAESTPSLPTQHEGERISLTARIDREPEIREKNIFLYVIPIDINTYGTKEILVTTNRYAHEALDLSYGDTIEVTGVLTLPEAFASDGGRMFDYPGYLKARGVIYTLPFAHVAVTTQEKGTLLGYLFHGKQIFQKKIEMIIPEPHAGLGEGLLLGVKRALGKNLEDTFRRTGIIHIVVLSGYNIMLVVECVLFLLSFLFFPRMRMIVGIIAIVLFAILVGLSATVIRASIMATLLLIARTTGRTYAVLRALTFAGIMMLLINPYLLVHDPGFQLSFLATLGLIFVTPWIESFLTSVPTRFGIRGFVGATLGTQLFVLPFLLYQMGTLSIVAVLVNVLILPMVPLAMLLTFFTGVVGMVSTALGYGVGYLAYLSLGYIILVAQLFGSLPFAAVSVHAFPFWIVLVVYALYIFILTQLNQERGPHTLPAPNALDTENKYHEWTVVDFEEFKSPPEALRASGGVKTPLPFR
jgi:competence protein ComEC